MDFQFVDNSAVSAPNTRRIIRQHVMKGKNLGKKIQGRGRKHAPGIAPGAAPGGDARPTSTGEDAQLLFPAIAAQDFYSIFTGTEFEYLAFPTQFNSKMRYIIHQFFTAIADTLYPHEFCRRRDYTKGPWMEYMAADQAFLHCLLAMAATYINMFRTPGSETLEATRHFSQAIRLVNSRLSTSSTPTDGTLAVIVTFAIHCSLMNDVGRMEIHLRGLEKALTVRPGGILSLRQTNEDLAHKIYRTDLEYAIKSGMPSFFGPWELLRAGPLSEKRLGFPLNQTCSTLRTITRHILEFCSLPEKKKPPGMDYLNAVTWAWQRLVDFAPLSRERPQNPLEDILQLSLLAFLITVNYSIDFVRMTHTALLRNMLRERVERDPLASLGRDYLPLRLWVGIIYGLLLSNGEEPPTSQLNILAAELGLKSWREAKSCLRPFPWIKVVHENLGKKLWEDNVQYFACENTE